MLYPALKVSEGVVGVSDKIPARPVVFLLRVVILLILSLFLLSEGRVFVRAMLSRGAVARAVTCAALRALMRFVLERAVVPRVGFVCERAVVAVWVTAAGARLIALRSRTAPLAMPTVANNVAISI